MQQRLFFTDEHAENRFFQYVLGRQPSAGWILVVEQEPEKQKNKSQRDVLMIYLFLDARYFGKKAMITSGELKQRFGRSVDVSVHLIDSKISTLLLKKLPKGSSCVLEKTLPYTVYERLQETMGKQGVTFAWEEHSWQEQLRVEKTA